MKKLLASGSASAQQALDCLRNHGLHAALYRADEEIADAAAAVLGRSVPDVSIRGGIYPRRSELAAQAKELVDTLDPIYLIIAMRRGFRIEWASLGAWRVQMTPSFGQGQHMAHVDALGDAVALVIDMFTGGVPLKPEDPRRVSNREHR